jgi:hypothetical protein
MTAVERARRTLDSPIAAALLVAACYVAFVAGLWSTRDHDWSRFIVLGANSVDHTQLPDGLALVPDSVGYDGTSFYRFALAPFTRDVKEYGITLDMPAYRHQRILYPLLVWMLAAGDPARVPFLLVAVNLLALIAIAVCGALLARHYGRHALWVSWLHPLHLARSV